MSELRDRNRRSREYYDKLAESMCHYDKVDGNALLMALGCMAVNTAKAMDESDNTIRWFLECVIASHKGLLPSLNDDPEVQSS